MDPNPLADREKALENQWIREKEKRMAKERADRAQASKGDAESQNQQSQQSQQSQRSQQDKK